MIGRNHLVFGVGTTFLVGKVFGMDVGQISAMMPLTFVGSLLPDIDLMRSRLKRKLWVQVVTLPLTLFGHRTWSHSLAAMLLVSAPVFFLPEMYRYMWVGLIIGFASHLVGDWMTPKGIPLLYPRMKAFRAPYTFKAGSLIEYPVALIPLLLGGVWTFLLG